MSNKKEKLHFSTKSIHIGNDTDETGSAVAPIHLSTTFKQPSFASTEEFVYSRVDSPTVKRLEENLAMLENANYAYAFSSGMAAMTAIFTMFKPGDHVIISKNVYGGVFRLVTRVLDNNGVDFEFLDTTDVENIKKAVNKNTKLIHLETPSNPLLELADIRSTSEICKKNNILLSIDNTFMSPYGQRPLDLGADIVMHSTTKFISGHCDVLSGALMINDEQVSEKIKLIQNTAGAVVSPFDAWLLLRSVKTISLRVQKQFDNAKYIADWLDNNPKVTKVVYPGLPSHSQFELASQQQFSPDNKPVYGSMISFEINNDIDLNNFAKKLNIITLAESLGGVKSLISCPYSMTHASVPEDEKIKLGITPNLLRFSVGIEHVEDLISELDFAMDDN